MRTWPAYVAEFIGTFALVFIGPGAVVLDEHLQGGLGTLGVAIAFGIVVTAMVALFGNLSGAHINPAVTIAFWRNGRISFNKMLGYLSAQCSGALAASYCLLPLAIPETSLGITSPSIGVWPSFLLELLLTFILMLVIFLLAERFQRVGLWMSLGIGGTVMLEAFLAGPLTGASMNPARSLGPAIASGQVGHLWIYLIAPIAGSLAALGLYCIIRGPSCCTPVEQAQELIP